MAGFWAKLPLIMKLLLFHPEIEFLLWMDSDAMFTNMAFEVPWERHKDHNFVMHRWNEMGREKGAHPPLFRRKNGRSVLPFDYLKKGEKKEKR